MFNFPSIMKTNSVLKLWNKVNKSFISKVVSRFTVKYLLADQNILNIFKKKLEGKRNEVVTKSEPTKLKKKPISAFGQFSHFVFFFFIYKN